MNKKLHIGCGKDIKEGYVNLDKLKLPGVDVVQDLDKFPYPFKENTFEEVYTSHTLEHVKDLIATMQELHRIAKPHARIVIRVPHFSCGTNYRDPTHLRYFSYFTFDFFTTDSFYRLPTFKVINKELNFTRTVAPWLNQFINPLLNAAPGIYERFFCWIFPASEVLVELEVVK